MTLAFDPSALPPTVACVVEEVLRERDGHERAIEAIKTALERERGPDLLIALAIVVYDDAASVVLHRLGAASVEALGLLDEAARIRGTGAGLESLREVFEATRSREAERERCLRVWMLAPHRAPPEQLVELAHRLRMAGDDRVGTVLMEQACSRRELRDSECAGHRTMQTA